MPEPRSASSSSNPHGTSKLELRLDANIHPPTGTEERYATGAILVPAALRTSRDPKVAAFVNHFFPRREWTSVDVRVSPTSVLVFANQVKNLSATSFALMFERAPAPAAKERRLSGGSPT